MKFILKPYSIWEFGQRTDDAGNPHQEDNLYPAFGQATDADRLFIVCDGMGGHSAGEVASEAVCTAMAASILGDGRSSEGVFTDADLAKALKAAYDSLDARDNGDARKMGTTMTMLKLHSQGATIAHIGDSRVYHIRPGVNEDSTRILYASEDHSLVNQLVRAGHMTHEEARRSNQKNIITRAMQPGLDPRPQADVYHTADIQPGDWFMLCSDGMLEHPLVEDGTYLRQLFSMEGGTPKEKVDSLIEATVNNSDNHTAILVRILDVQDPTGLRAAGIPDQGQVTQVYPDSPSTPGGVAPQASWLSAQSKTQVVKVPHTHKSNLPKIIGAIVAVLLLVAAVVWGCMMLLNRNAEQPAVEAEETIIVEPAEMPQENAPDKEMPAVDKDKEQAEPQQSTQPEAESSQSDEVKILDPAQPEGDIPEDGVMTVSNTQDPGSQGGGSFAEQVVQHVNPGQGGQSQEPAPAPAPTPDPEPSKQE